MSDWLMISVPAAVFLYLVAYPENGQQVMQWLGAFLR